MQIPRKILILLITVALLAVGVAASIAMLYPRLPDPQVADREGLLRWLVTRDLRGEPIDTRRALARRFEEEFCKACDTAASDASTSDAGTSDAGTSDAAAAPDWESLAEQLDASQRQQFWENLTVVLEPWFLDKTDGYCEVSETERTAYLDRLIDMIAVMDGIDAIRPNSDESADHAEDGGLYALLLEQTQQWKQKAEPSRQERIDRLLIDMQKRYILRTLGFSTTPN
ncbi:MAG TPA: hypothetical protein VE890_05030 [Thermoguttaceae bacterium]|nr:hypothetical protein [Thermoguttaceae bacterium]